MELLDMVAMNLKIAHNEANVGGFFVGTSKFTNNLG